MPLSDDQKALLRLLAQREQGYEDIGALMGLSVEQVRGRVREALAALNQEVDAGTPPRRDAEPAAPAPPPRPQADAPAEAPQTEASSSSLRHGSAEPRAQRKPPLPPAQPPRAAAPAQSRISLPRDRRRLFELAGGAVVVILLVLFATGLVNIDGGGSGSSTSTTAAATAPTEAAGGEGAKLTQAVLKPVGGGSAAGRALFGRVGKNVVLEVVAQGLEPSPSGQSYAVWLYRSPKLVLRVGAVKVPKSGGLAARFPIPAELLAYVAGGAFKQIDVSLVSDAAYEREVVQAKRQKRLPPYTGTDVLRGEITGPIIKK